MVLLGKWVKCRITWIQIIFVYFLLALIKAMMNMPSSQKQFVEDKVILKEFVILVVQL